MTSHPPDIYDKIASKYDSFYQDAKSYREDNIVSHIMASHGVGTGVVVDIGCGTGHSIRLLDFDPNGYIGVDPSCGMLAKARCSFPEHYFKRGTAESIPVKDPVDSIIATFGSFSYCPRPVDAVEEMHRCLKPGGKLAVMAYSDKNEGGLILQSEGLTANRHLYTANSLKSLFSSKFENVKVYGVRASSSPFMWVDYLIGKWFPSMCTHLIVTATKGGSNAA